MQLQHIGIHEGFRLALHLYRSTRLAAQATVGSHPGIPSSGVGSGQLAGNDVALAEVHLIRCLASEVSVWKDGVVLLDVERDQPVQGGEGIELMQVEPAVLERAETMHRSWLSRS